tara:strand:+ start:160 stop:336 length:177 start_codon:yes stop_codon:yes gene_type:complete
MYKLKKEYQGVDLHTKGGIIRLDLVKSDEVELKGLEKYFTKSTKPKKPKKTDIIGGKL